MTYQEAISYCEDLTLGGYTNWRLPILYELADDSFDNYVESNTSYWVTYTNSMYDTNSFTHISSDGNSSQMVDNNKSYSVKCVIQAITLQPSPTSPNLTQ
jgi:hypothetical protein